MSTIDFTDAVCIVNNVPSYAGNHHYWVVTPDKGDLWFWGAWDVRDEALKGKNSDDQLIVVNPNWRKKDT